MDCDGDFRSSAVSALRDEADMVITNPPFSLFREFVQWIIQGEVQFSIIGNVNAVTYREFFPLIRDKKAWLGNSSYTGHTTTMKFRVPDHYPVSNSQEDHSSVAVMATWYTSIEHGGKNKPLDLDTMDGNMHHNTRIAQHPHSYQKYDNYDAINIPYVRGIPRDYDGVMGVPVTFMTQYCPDQFDIVGATESEGKGFSAGLHDGGPVKQATIGGKRVYKRIFIRARQ